MTFGQKLTKNILDVYDYMLKNGIIESKEDFCNTIGISASAFGMVQAGEIDFPQDKIYDFEHNYHVNCTYTIHGKGSMFRVKVNTLQMEAKRRKQNKACVKDRFTSLENKPGSIDLIMN